MFYVYDLRRLQTSIKKYKRKEESLHSAVVRYVVHQYPDLILRTDYASGLRMTMGQALKNKSLQTCSKWPDIQICRASNGYTGLFIELKKEGASPFKKDGTLRKCPHTEAQWVTLQRLSAEGYLAVFGVGFDSVKKIIDDYLK